jgi:peptidoglycan/xylan/chitin deacetylase (PgdA/CDA1 family)
MSTATPERLFVAVTADVDPDANRAVAGRVDAVSAGAAPGEVRLDACFEGLRALACLLEEMSLPAAFFWEGRTLEELARREPDLLRRVTGNRSFEHGCHGYRHEDFAGTESGIVLGADETKAILRQAGQIIESVLGVAPKAFRAPYCRLTPQLASSLAEMGYTYDATLIRRASARWPLRPYGLPEAPGLWELAICKARDRRGRPISAYVWQLLEGNRPVQDYVDLVEQMSAAHPGGLLQLAVHPWHLIVAADGSPLGARQGKDPAGPVRALLDRMRRMPSVSFTTPAAYLESVLRGPESR